MAQSDWVLSVNTDNASASQTAEPYSPGGTIPAPSGSSGSYARRLTATGAGGNSYVGFYPADSAFSGVANTNAIRVSCYWRLPTYGSFPGTARAFQIGAKATPPGSIGNDDIILTGYYIHVGRTTGFDNASLVRLLSGGTVIATLRNTTPSNTWYSYRLSVYPVSPVMDRIIAEYESSPGSGVWSSAWPQGSGDCLVTGGTYIGWGGSTRNGVWSPGGGDVSVVWIDMMQVTLGASPTPIP